MNWLQIAECKRFSIAVVGLGYVGLPVAVAFGKSRKVLGYDINEKRISELTEGYDITKEVSSSDIKNSNIQFTTNPTTLKDANIIIVCVPTPIDDANRPDLSLLKSASRIIGQNMSRGTVIVYESTVYPGVTEGICIPILEKESNLRSGLDFKVGYSPERINPGDKVHTFGKVAKVVSGQDDEALEIIAKTYESIIEAEVHRAPSIKVAEAAKVIENTQRDLNIALMNELAMLFNKLDIDTQSVLKAAGTKWNFLQFMPGLVGGHCIGVDPYYLTHKAEEIGYHSQVILAGRRINDYMGKYVAEQTIKKLIRIKKTVKDSRTLILGFSFKENIGDPRNTRVYDIYNELKDYDVEPFIYDPWVDKNEAKSEYGIELISSIEDGMPYDAFIIAVAHNQFLELSTDSLKKLGSESFVIIDVRGMLNSEEINGDKIIYWRM